MLALVSALPYEIAPILKGATKEKYHGIISFKTRISQKPVVIYLCKPGLPHKNQFRRFLRSQNIRYVVLSGFCGKLSGRVQRYNIVMPSAVFSGGKVLNISGEQATGMTMVSVKRPAVTQSLKADIFTLTRADTVDMESFRFAEVLSEPEFSHLSFGILKIVDDLPHEERYLEKDHHLRDTEHDDKKLSRWKSLLARGWLDIAYIAFRRRRTSTRLCKALGKFIAKI